MPTEEKRFASENPQYLMCDEAGRQQKEGGIPRENENNENWELEEEEEWKCQMPWGKGRVRTG